MGLRLAKPDQPYTMNGNQPMACDMKKSTTKQTKPKKKAKKVAVAGAGKDMSKRKVYG